MAGKDSNSLVISLSVFVLLTVGLGIAWYMTWSHSDNLQTQLNTSKTAETESKAAIQKLNGEIEQLKVLIGRQDQEITDLVENSKKAIADRAASGIPLTNLEAAMVAFAADRDAGQYNAADRKAQLDAKTAELQQRIVAQEEAKKSLQDSLAAKEQELLDKERTHAEQLAQREKQIDDLTSEKNKLQDDYANFKADRERVIEELQKENMQQRAALIDLRREKFKLEGITFERPDGELTFVDQNKLSCYLNLGRRDELRVGTTFSVYKKNNSGVGRSQSDKDLKGKIEVVSLISDHVAEARIVEQDLDDPLADGDPIYSPIFFPGQKLEIAVVGGLEFDGNPGSDREEFQRIVTGAGAEIVLQVTDLAKLIDKNGNPVDSADIDQLITSKTRFLVVGDLGDEDTEDTVQKSINEKIRQHHEDMVRAAENNGVYLLNLASFLDYIGYSRKRLAWTPTSDFPGVLNNGSRSTGVNSSRGGRESSAAISGAFSKSRRTHMESTGSTSGLYKNTNSNED